jgi:prepilin-type N-terminal cleavage/methylation domain-containing protein
MIYLNSNKNKEKKGFTLVEMIVSLFVFSIAALVASGAFLSIISADKKAQSAKTVINNLNYSLESISREVRLGSSYYCSTIVGDNYPSVSSSQDCDGGNYLAFKDSSGSNYKAYYFKDDGILYKCDATSGDALSNSTCYSRVTSSGLKINSGVFIVSNSNTDYARVRVYIEGIAGDKEKTQTQFKVQTTIAKRL